MEKPILAAENVSKIYASRGGDLRVVDKVTFSLRAGDTAALVGPSGSGKTTLLSLCAGLDRPSEGRVSLEGYELSGLGEDSLAELRNRYVGFVFQNFQLLPSLTALENVMVPAELRGVKTARRTALELLERVGLGARHEHYPAQLSGGEQQRVALARAYCNKPRILFADEPTGNLDTETALRIEDLLFELNRSEGTTLLLATHNLELAGRTERVLRMKGGTLSVEVSKAVKGFPVDVH